MIVVNATVLSNLAWVTWLSILKELFGEMLIPLPVYEEILKGIDTGYAFLKSVDELVEKGDWITLGLLKDEHEKRLFKSLLDSVGYGEAAGIAIAKRRALHFFSDDRVAREAAEQQGVEISGTLGILKVAVEEGKLSTQEADEVLREMIRGGYRSPIQSVKELLEGQIGGCWDHGERHVDCGRRGFDDGEARSKIQDKR